MLDHAREVVPDLREFPVHLDDLPHAGPPGIFIARRRGSFDGETDLVDDMISTWMIATYAPDAR